MADKKQNRYSKIKWLIDKNVLIRHNVDSENVGHYITTCDYLFKYIKTCPISVYIHEMGNDMLFRFQYFESNIEIPYNLDMYPNDHVQLLKYWVYKFVIRYKLYIDTPRPMTSEEVSQSMINNTNQDIEDLYNTDVVSSKLNTFYIEKVIIINDELVCINNGVREVRITTLPASIFMKECKRIRDNQDVYNYVNKNTRLINTIPFRKTINIRYEDNRFSNFLLANMPEMYRDKQPFIRKNDNYQWGYFFIESKNRSVDMQSFYNEAVDKYQKYNNDLVFIEDCFNVNISINKKRKVK